MHRDQPRPSDSQGSSLHGRTLGKLEIRLRSFHFSLGSNRSASTSARARTRRYRAPRPVVSWVGSAVALQGRRTLKDTQGRVTSAPRSSCRTSTCGWMSSTRLRSAGPGGLSQFIRLARFTARPTCFNIHFSIPKALCLGRSRGGSVGPRQALKRANAGRRRPIALAGCCVDISHIITILVFFDVDASLTAYFSWLL